MEFTLQSKITSDNSLMSDRRRWQSAAQPSTRRTHTAFVALIALFSIGPASGTARAAALSWDADVGFTHDDNVTRAQRNADMLKDKFVAVSAGASYLQWLNSNNRMVYRG